MINNHNEIPSNVSQANDFRDYITVKQLASENPAFTEGGVRCLIFHCKTNGFDSCIRRIGRRVLISRSALCNWIESQNRRNV